MGNAVINDETDNIGMYTYFGNHALISDDLAQKILKSCDFSPNATSQSDECNQAADDAGKDTSYINIYNIYGPLCPHEGTTARPGKPSVSN